MLSMPTSDEVIAAIKEDALLQLAMLALLFDILAGWVWPYV